MVATHEVVHELTAERGEQRRRLAEALAEDARPPVGLADLRGRIAADRDQRPPDGVPQRELPLVPLAARGSVRRHSSPRLRWLIASVLAERPIASSPARNQYSTARSARPACA